VVDQLVRNGRPSSTPVAVITQGTTQRQRCVIGTLHNIIGKVRSERLEPPSVIVVGDVVRLRESLSWYDQTPCSEFEKNGKRE
jgi:uroporphyrinogen III methyltransferase / synthase